MKAVAREVDVEGSAGQRSAGAGHAGEHGADVAVGQGLAPGDAEGAGEAVGGAVDVVVGGWRAGGGEGEFTAVDVEFRSGCGVWVGHQ